MRCRHKRWSGLSFSSAQKASQYSCCIYCQMLMNYIMLNIVTLSVVLTPFATLRGTLMLKTNAVAAMLLYLTSLYLTNSCILHEYFGS